MQERVAVDHVFVDNTTGVMRKEIVTKDERLVLDVVRGSGLAVEPVPEALRKRACLTDAEVAMLVATGKRIEALFGQILVDEVGHVHYVRSTLNATGLEWAQRLMPVVAWGALRDLPELVELFGRDEIIKLAMTADVDAAARSYPDRFVFAA